MSWKAKFMAPLVMKPALSLGGVLVASAMLAAAHSYAYPGGGGPFIELSGHWSGVGTIIMADGSSERLRCKESNAVNASETGIQQSLRCASASYRLDISSNVVAEGGSLSGSWGEATRGVSGNISGRTSGSAILANVAGAGFTARIDVRTHGDKQFVTITPQSGTDVARVSVALHK
jgi:hypothetical protein